MKVTLQLDGRDMTFTERELVAIVKEHLSRKTTKKTYTTKVAQKPTEDEWFEVKPQAIDQKLFEKKRKSKRQEATRQLILEAFSKVKDNPEKYSKNFKTMMPKKTWESKSVADLKEIACELGDHNADWVEQALEWAQRIANGESWKAICNDKDTANWYRLVVWKNGFACIVGGSACFGDYIPASAFSCITFGDNHKLDVTVPLVVIYE